MSLILDALKKSEQQRQREKTPTLQSIHHAVAAPAKKTARPWWFLISTIVVLNIGALGYWFFDHRNAKPTTESADVSEHVVAKANPVQAAPVEQSVPLTKPVEPVGNQSEFTEISPHQRIVQSLPDATEVGQRPIEEVSDLPERVRNDLPAMTFSFHVYSDNPEQRTIIINDRRLREGDQIKTGLQLLNITQDGVVLLFEQHRIHISVLSEW